MNETKVFRMKKNIVIIPARYKSIRFPGKPLAKISDKSMIQYIYDSIKNYSFIDKIIVATDDYENSKSLYRNAYSLCFNE